MLCLEWQWISLISRYCSVKVMMHIIFTFGTFACLLLKERKKTATTVKTFQPVVFVEIRLPYQLKIITQNTKILNIQQTVMFFQQK